MEQSESEAEQRFGNAVRKARDERGWTQERLRRRLVEQTGVELSQTAMARLEAGKRPIRLNEAVALAQVLTIALDTFVAPDGDIDPEELPKYEEALETLRNGVNIVAQQLADLGEQARVKQQELGEAQRLYDLLRFRVEAARRRGQR